MFDIKDFASVTQEAPLDDKFNLVPEGEYQAMIPTDPAKAFESKSGEKDDRPWAQLSVRLEILDPSGAIEKELGRKPGITDRFFLDVMKNNAGQTVLDVSKQKNVRLGQYLSAVGLNAGGWNFNQMCGKTLKIKVVHGRSDMDPTQKVARVTTLGRG